MGQSLRCHRGSRQGTLRSLRKKKRPLSTTRPLSDSLLAGCNQVNLNMASEEELMTLPGVSRGMAHSIAVYRHRIGGFRKVEDLALVAGFGAEKMQQLRSEICVGCVQPASRPIQSSCWDLPSSTKVNLNTASMAELLRLGCLSEELAQAILSYRTGHGAFRHLKDLEKVDGVNEILLKKIEPHLTISLPRPATVHGDLNWADFCESRTGQPKEGKVAANGPGSTALQAIQHTQTFTGLYAGRRVLRVGSCTLQGLTLVMAEDKKLREELCLALLENGITLLAIQEVLEEAALERLCREMETPSLPSVGDWPGPRGSWRYVIPEYEDETQEVERPAFLWDSTSGLELVSVSNVEMGEPGVAQHPQQCQPLLGHFKVEQLDFKLLSVHLKYLGNILNAASHVTTHLQSLKHYLEDGPQLLILGVYRNGLGWESLSFLKDCGFCHCIPASASLTGKEDPTPGREASKEVGTTEGSSHRNIPHGCSRTLTQTPAAIAQPSHAGSMRTTDPPLNNIWSSSAIQAAVTGQWGVTLNELQIPQPRCDQSGRSAISNSCLMWVELYRS
ncbi:endonuclease/exonuclease/phosphatase family domain-containing protein 1-like [Ambystoma mexicanum]|uniref:endonuclease/exonuclease/phosphatase family domain-containing protein 1-like n=1 Tax=Ambystoma mexicanum TaxID=8296 RepID=UPI0037E901AD